MKKILLITTGGTIVSEEKENGLEPVSSSDELLSFVSEMSKHYNIDIESILNIDSSNMQPEEWKLIGKFVYKNIFDYDGIIITHGTDTLAYTSSMLSFMLKNLPIGVILTGSQLPINSPFSDGKINIATAFAAIDQGVIGVNVAFNHKVIKGTRAVKVRTMGFNAFESINFPYVCEFSADGKSRQPINYEPNMEEATINTKLCPEVFLLKLIPGTDPDIFDFILSKGYKGVVIEAFGAGGLHFIRRDLLMAIEKIIICGVVVVVCSQCLYEKSDLTIYEPGRKILSIGVIQGRDMTTESAVTKLMWSLGQGSSINEIKEIFATNLADEISIV